jgi:thiamine-phosphate pyrophosphorylase
MRVSGEFMIRKNIDYSLYLVTDRRWLGGKSLESAVEEAIQGGATVVQLREKDISSREYLEIARRVKAVTYRLRIPLIINDRIDIAFACDADGIHLGSDDLPVAVARAILGPEKIVGASAATLEEALALEAEGADYLGVGAIFPTGTKTDADHVTLEKLVDIKSAVKIPVVAIGGIDAGNVASVMAAGVDGVAIVSAIMAQGDILGAARNIAGILKAKLAAHENL